jgi:hypothetical protein
MQRGDEEGALTVAKHAAAALATLGVTLSNATGHVKTKVHNTPTSAPI